MTPSGSLLEAGTWLTLRIYRNRIRGVVRRLRSPRYAVALLVGVAYLALVFGHGRGDRGPFTPDLVEGLGGVFLALMVAKWWLFGADRLALAFSPAEVGFLFPAPVTRTALLGYKLLRAQPLLLVNVAVWLVLLERGPGAELPLPLYALSLWGVFTLMLLHRLGVALTRDALTQHGRAAWKRHWLAVLLLLAAAAGLAAVFRRLPSVGLGEDPTRPFGGLDAVLTSPPLGWVLWPFRLVFLPLTASSIAQWALRFPVVLGLIGLHLLWIFRADRAFEEAALEASARRAALLERWRRHGSTASPVRRGGVRIA
ncbi:MAG TPA: putative ABC exporter domain-containing protein, partial [Gemmatimonadales bacterium]|nr:putative ABC exporter domain-containing protein [Gemmatimonadales bacterium]